MLVCAEGSSGPSTKQKPYRLSVFKSRRPFNELKSLYIRQAAGKYFVSFCFDDGSETPATDSDNRKSQERFSCDCCGHVDNADRNAARVIRKRAINLIQDFGMELIGKGIPVLTTGRGANRKLWRWWL